MKRSLILMGLAMLVVEAALATDVRVVCTSRPTICTTFGDDTTRFDPFVQHLLVQRELARLPKDWQITSFYVPYRVDPRELEEIQIRYLDQMNQRREMQAAMEAAAERGTRKALEEAATASPSTGVEPDASQP